MDSDHGWRAYLPEVAFAVAMAAGLVVWTLFVSTQAAVPDVGDYVLVAGCAAGLVAVRRAPSIALLVVTVTMLGFVVRVHPGSTAAFPVLAAVYVAARSGRRVPAAVAGLAFLAGFFAVDLSAAGAVTPELPERTLLLTGWFVAAGVMGVVSRHRRAYLQQVEQRAVDAERTREETALRRAGEERLRIARELHDSLTHSISLIKLQAGVAVHLARKRGDEAPAALLAIQEASRDAMRELRDTLKVLRASGDDPGNGLGQVDDLVERALAAGLSAALTTSGQPRPVPEAVGRVAYRVVQEALTNVSRHSGGATAAVHIGHTARALVVRVDDDGIADPARPPEPGAGLSGMAERVTGLGGHLRAEPRPDGGFTVQATLPRGADPREST